MLIKIYFENGAIDVYPLGNQYSVVELNATEVLKKHEAYDIVKWARTYNNFPPTRNFVLTENVFPLDKEGTNYRRGPVKKYEIVSFNNELLWEYAPVVEFENDDEMVDFWNNMLSIPL